LQVKQSVNNDNKFSIRPIIKVTTRYLLMTKACHNKKYDLASLTESKGMCKLCNYQLQLKAEFFGHT